MHTIKVRCCLSLNLVYPVEQCPNPNTAVVTSPNAFLFLCKFTVILPSTNFRAITHIELLASEFDMSGEDDLPLQGWRQFSDC